MIEKAQKFQDLIVWQKAHKFVLNIYKMTEELPKSELYGLTSQIRRASISIPANVAEGFKRRGLKEKARFFNIAQGSIEEVTYYLILINDLGYFKTERLNLEIKEVGKILEGYCKKLRDKI